MQDAGKYYTGILVYQYTGIQKLSYYLFRNYTKNGIITNRCCYKYIWCDQMKEIEKAILNIQLSI